MKNMQSLFKNRASNFEKKRDGRCNADIGSRMGQANESLFRNTTVIGFKYRPRNQEETDQNIYMGHGILWS